MLRGKLKKILDIRISYMEINKYQENKKENCIFQPENIYRCQYWDQKQKKKIGNNNVHLTPITFYLKQGPIDENVFL